MKFIDELFRFSRISKATMKKKSDDTKMNYGTQKKTMKEKNSSDFRAPASKLFRKSKRMKTPSPLPMTIGDVSKETHDKTRLNKALSCSSSTNSDLPKQKKRSKDRSYVESYDGSRETSIQKRIGTQPRKPSNGSKSPAKSKLVLENVRKMIKDQNIQQQQQHLNHSQGKESARL
jgi:hypothetical protein